MGEREGTGEVETGRWGDGVKASREDTVKVRHGDTGMGRRGDTVKARHGDTATRGHGERRKLSASPRRRVSPTPQPVSSSDRLPVSPSHHHPISASPRPRVAASPRRPVSPSPRPRVSASLSRRPLVAVIMGSKSDWETMREADQTLTKFGVPHECRVLSAHRTPHLAAEYSSSAESHGLEVVIAAAGGAAHLAGVIAAHTILPVLGVPMKSDSLNGIDSLLSTVQMPAGIPVGTLAIGKAGAVNAALLAIAILANSRPELREKLREFRQQQEEKIRAVVLE